MTVGEIGQTLIGVAALFTLLIPIGVDGALLPRMHMRNPRWLPHAKLHCAMSFFAAISLGVGALALLALLSVQNLGGMALAAFLSTAFWIGLIVSGWWPGTSYGFEQDPGFIAKPPKLLGVTLDPNVILAVLSIALGWIGFALIVIMSRR
ncbi:MAG: hypothetical protein JO182_29635 [Acidobacteriaceae bacterium]|nr:hypothetical protein [Acidobacteriaceae bacterium]MBV9225027.1 hypothetical protein [Acidobacteriaceae bacterium]MBV9308774.1 hypothetical protein [Acidobacteriaceae bacterium]